jgi:uncharacterized protein (TIGR03437 family)
MLQLAIRAQLGRLAAPGVHISPLDGPIMLNPLSRRAPRCVILTQLVLLTVPLSAANLTLQISSETAPAGGWAQIKVFSQTPQLISSGRILMKFDPAVFGTISSVAVFSAQGDAMGIAAVDGASLDVSFSSPASGIGQLPHLPVLTVTIPILAKASTGTVTAITLDASQAQWTGPQYTAYSVTAVPGSVTVGGSLSVQNLTPGGGLLPAGAPVRIHGAGFSAATTVTIDGVGISSTQFAGATEIDLTLAGAADLTGKRVVLRNPDGAQIEYFSSMPSVPDQSPAYVPSVQPLLSMRAWTSAAVFFATPRGGAIALQNPHATAVDVVLQTPTQVSVQETQTTVNIPPGALRVYDSTTGYATGLRAFASQPLRMLGMGYAYPEPGQPTIYIAPPYPTLPPEQELIATPAAVSFHWQIGTAEPAPVTVSLGTTQFHSKFNFRATSPAPPFSVTLTQTASPALLTVAANPAGLSAGTYTGSIVLTPEGPNAVVTTIPLSLTVSAAPLLAVSPQSLSFNSDYSQILTVQSSGDPLAFTAASSDGAGPHWLTVTPSSATAPAQLTVTVRSANLSQGTYTGQIAITGPNNTVTIPVQLNADGSNSFTFSPASATFSVQTGPALPLLQKVLVSGPSTGAVFSASTSSGGAWLSVEPLTAPPLAAVIAANPAGLKAGTYTGTVTLTSPDSPLPARLPVTLVVWDTEPVLTVTPTRVTLMLPLDGRPTTTPPSQMVQVTSGGVPLNFVVNSAPGLFTTPASIPVPAIFSYLLSAYTYDFVVTAGTQKVVVPVATVVTTAPLTPPFLGSIVNAASQLPGSVAPGEILTVYGFGAGPSNTAGFTLDPSGKVATSLNGAQVLFDGRPAPMIYGSAWQANVIVPYEVAAQATTTISLQFDGVTSAAWTIPVAPSAPGVFTLASNGLGPAAVLNQDNSVNSAANPARRGSVIQIFAAGEGETSPHGVTGSVIGTDLKTPVLAVKVTIGGQDAVVQYAGSAGASVAGLFQVNALIPPSVAPAAAVPIAISVGGVPSQNGVTIAVQ